MRDWDEVKPFQKYFVGFVFNMYFHLGLPQI
jgi:hypothetical protein